MTVSVINDIDYCESTEYGNTEQECDCLPTYAHVCVDTRISRGARQAFVVLIGYVLLILRIAIKFSESKINEVNHTCFRFSTHKEVVRFYISVNIVFGVKDF